jgi:MFS family permease
MTYRDVVRVPHVPRLLVGTLVGRLPNGMAALAMALVLREVGTGFGFIGIVVGSYLTAAAVAGPLLGRLVDHYGPRWVMVSTAGCGGAALTVLAACPDRHPAVLAAAVAAGVATPPLEPTLRALWPRLMPPRLLRHAYGVDASSQTLIFVVGPVLVSAAAGWGSPPSAVLLAALLMLAGTALVVSSPAIRGTGAAAAGWPHSGHEWRGVRERLWTWPYGVLVAGLAGAGGSVGAFNVFALDYTAQCTLLGGAGSAGSLPAAAAMAGLLCGLALGGLGWRRWRVRVLAALLAVGSAAPIVTPVCSPAVYLSSAAAGMFLPPLLGSAFVLVNLLVPAGRSAEALAWLTTMFITGSAVASALAGGAVELAGPTGAAVVGAGMAAAGAVVCLGLRSVDA